MSVYTEVTVANLRQFLQRYAIGEPLQLQGISEGIENTNYFVTTEQGEYVLTLFESLTAIELPFFLNLMAFFSERHIPCAHPVADKNGRLFGELNHRPCAIVKRLSGVSLTTPTPSQCGQIGAALAKMHRVSLETKLRRPNQYGPKWRKQVIDKLSPLISASDTQILQSEQRYLQQTVISDLPAGIIHGDLFCDNVLFNEQKLTGIIDLYNASNGEFIYDIAVSINDWCSEINGDINPIKMQSFLSSYHQFRPLAYNELNALPTALRNAAIRFWLSRLMENHFPRAGHLVHLKSPETFKQILLSRITKNPKPLDLSI